MQVQENNEKIIRDFIHAYAYLEYETLESLMAENIIAYITNKEGGSDQIKGRNAFMKRIHSGTIPGVIPQLTIMQLHHINSKQVLIMIEVQAEFKDEKLLNYAAYLINIDNDQISEIHMVEAKPEHSDQFWKRN